jgi:putative nucleotidyltransferase with HDIG domain
VAQEKILVVDDEDSIREVISTLLSARGYQCATAQNGREAMHLFAHGSPDLVLSDIVMPEMDGMRLLEQVQSRDNSVPLVMVTAMHDINTALEAIRRGAYDYLLKPFEKEQLYLSVRRALEHRRLTLDNQRYQTQLEKLVAERTEQLTRALGDLEQSYDYTLEALGSALDLKDKETEGHCQRVTAFTIAIAKGMGIAREQLRHIARGAFLHDIGKMGVPDWILRKPGPLTDEERAVVRKHCDIGYEMVRRIPFLKDAAEIVWSHQEFYDGTGYPRNLRGEEIPLGARIFAIADTLDAMISDRPYRSALPLQAAKEEIKRCAGTQFDPKVVEAFLALPDHHWQRAEISADDPLRLSQLRDL